MPELPEVETVAAALREGGRRGPPVLGRTIVGSRLNWPRTLAEPGRSAFQKRIRGQVIRAIARRGKFLMLRLSNATLLSHLRMSGDLIATPQGVPLPRFTRLTLRLDGNLCLSFADARKFGRVWLTDEPDRYLAQLGPEPLDSAFSAARLHAMLAHRRRQIKPLLLDQTFVAGLGNIYTDEALNLAGVHPLRNAASLTRDEASTLWRSIRRVLRKGIRHGGTSFDWAYRDGECQRFLRVYRRAGLPCRRCQTPIVRTIVGQRGTHFCPRCQPDPN